MIEIKDIMPLGFLKKSRFTGSFQGMRFLLRKSGPEDSPLLEAVAWPEPYCFEASEESSHISASFPFSQEGIAQAVDWLGAVHQERFSTKSAF